VSFAGPIGFGTTRTAGPLLAERSPRPRTALNAPHPFSNRYGLYDTR
jgi:hypothetical protein